ncbi:MAG: hypothetical protein Q9174_003177 [Haloplaca sp. 1 TL-2023]
MPEPVIPPLCPPLEASRKYIYQHQKVMAEQRRAHEEERRLWKNEHSGQLEDQHQKTMTDQRRAHEEERHLWSIERAALLENIKMLQIHLRSYEVWGGGPSPGPGAETASSNLAGTGGSFGYELGRCSSGSGSKQWMRNLPELSPRSHIAQNRQPSAGEAGRSYLGNSRKPAIGDISPTPRPGLPLPENRRPSTPPHKLTNVRYGFDTNDGINFKSSTDSTAHSGRSRSVPREPATKPSPDSAKKPDKLRLPFALDPEKNLTMHAGHTPLAHTGLGLDGALSGMQSDVASPTRTDKYQQPQQADLHTPPVRKPIEHSDSYFPAPAEDESNNDPELREPLTLPNDASNNDSRFLSELNSKLREAAAVAMKSPEESVEEPAEEHDKKTVKAEVGGAGDEEKVVEDDPPLKFKKSSNFGSRLGEL